MSDLFEILNKLDELKYGWIDIYGETHLYSMKDFRRIYKTMSIETVLEKKLGICMEQVYLTHLLLDEKKIPNKMFCTRIYEGEDFNDLDADEHMHCFVLFYRDNKVYQLEHPNWERIGIYEFDNEESAINSINEYYINMSGGHARPVTEFYEVEPNLTFKEFNVYINSLDRQKRVGK